MKCKNCGHGHQKMGSNYGFYEFLCFDDNCDCKQFIPNHSQTTAGYVDSGKTGKPTSKEPFDKDPVITGKSVDSETAGSAFILSDEIEKIMKFHLGHNQGVMHVSEFKKHITNLNAEFIRLLKEVFSPNFEDDWAEKEIDKLAYRKGHKGDLK